MSKPLLDIEKEELASVTYVTKLARTKSPAAIDKLVELLDSEDERIQLAAANSILDRGLGKPAPYDPADDDDEDKKQPLRLVINNK